MDQMKDIVLQIMQDYEEKIEEIIISMESEFIYEKNKEMTKSIKLIDKKYQLKMNNVVKNHLIVSSKLKNNARLALLSKREALYHELVKDAKKQFRKSADPTRSRYRGLLSNLILQGLCSMNEMKVFIRCRPKDKSVITEIIPEVVAKYHKLSKKIINLYIDHKNTLSDSGFGGVIMTDEYLKITLNNGLEWKIEDVARKLIPEMISSLFKMKTSKEKYEVNIMDL